MNHAHSQDGKPSDDFDPARMLSALAHISPDCSRHEWLQVGMAMKHGGLSLDDWLTWSAGSKKFNRKIATRDWNSLKRNGGVTVRTLYGMARENGWTGDTVSISQRKEYVRPVLDEETVQRYKNAIPVAQIWEGADRLVDYHPYVKRKNLHQDIRAQLRIMRHHVTVAKQDVPGGIDLAGALLVPAFRTDGTLQTFQMIASDGTAATLSAVGRPGKLNAPGVPFGDAFFMARPVDDDEAPLFIVCEGIGQASSVHALSRGHAIAICAFGAGRILSVADTLQALHPAAKVALLPDQGYIIAQDRFVQLYLPDWLGKNEDINDLHAQSPTAALVTVNNWLVGLR